MYIVAVDDYLPVATFRLYPEDEECMMLGRVVVLPEYRRRGLGTRVAVESRDNKIPFYESMGYVPHLDRRIEGEAFTCYRMGKEL